MELSELEGLRVLYSASGRSTTVNTLGGKKAKKTNTGDETSKISPEMDCLINAGTRAYKCYRKPIAAFYENDRICKEQSVRLCSSRS